MSKHGFENVLAENAANESERQSDPWAAERALTSPTTTNASAESPVSKQVDPLNPVNLAVFGTETALGIVGLYTAARFGPVGPRIAMGAMGAANVAWGVGNLTGVIRPTEQFNAIRKSLDI